MNDDENDILQAAGHKALPAGKAYQRQGRVMAFQCGENDIVAQVQTSEHKLYRLGISSEANHNGLVTIEGDWSCLSPTTENTSRQVCCMD
ncbi:hypothetical protein [Rhizobium tumorigenes]|uniref:Uncharacterized protein n=1 Tax=Rhizobium tumorigenes TaxID=2041385 RepID=A0AAF1KX45_9HYPH|nr:hypothetical protein [Rhizobium tumorigenes]WFR99174.1 hypothetical protein PR017_27670 [Rhizobium tumorigenes]